jgi:hypothetical protein
MKKKNLIAILAIPCLLGAFSLRADDSMDSDMSQDQKVQPSENFMSTYDRVKTMEITPKAGPVVSGGVDAYFEVDYIYWHASATGLAYGESGLREIKVTDTAATLSTFSNTSLAQGKAYLPKFKTSSGFKVGAGLDFDYDGWDLGLTYTWLHSNVQESARVMPAPNLGTVNAGNGVNKLSYDLAENVAAKTTGRRGFYLHFNALDLELGRSFFISSKLVLRPHMGLKGSWQRLKTPLTYTMDNNLVDVDAETTLAVNETYRVRPSEYYWGLGTRFGVDTSWYVSKCFSFFGELSSSIMWNQVKLNSSSHSDVVNASTGASVVSNAQTSHVRVRTHRNNLVLESQIGMRYDYMFSDDEYRFRLQAGWEQQLWLSQFVEADNLSLQGLTLMMRIDF